MLPAVTSARQVPLLFPRNTMVSFYYACVVLTMAAFALSYWVERSRFGYYLMAIREDEDTALSVGVNTARVKLWSLLLSAARLGAGRRALRQPVPVHRARPDVWD